MMTPILEAFVKLLAPRPVLYVFPDLRGWWYAAAEDPETFQVISGVSLELFVAIRHAILERSGQNLDDLCDVVTAQGTSHRIERPARLGLTIQSVVVINLRPAPVIP
jgi:hypothetical protein